MRVCVGVRVCVWESACLRHRPADGLQFTVGFFGGSGEFLMLFIKYTKKFWHKVLPNLSRRK